VGKSSEEKAKVEGKATDTRDVMWSKWIKYTSRRYVLVYEIIMRIVYKSPCVDLLLLSPPITEW